MVQLKVVDAGDEIEPQPKASAAMAVGPSQNPEDLEATEDVLGPDAQPGLEAMDGSVPGDQRTVLSGLERQQCQRVLLLKNRIALIDQVADGNG